MRPLKSITAHVAAALLLSAAALTAAANLSLAPDEMTRTEKIRGGEAEFTIAVDGRTPPVNRAVTIAGPAENIRLHREGGLDFSSIDALVNSIIRPEMTDEEKVRAIFYFAVTSLYDRGAKGCDDPLEYVSLWGFSWCGNYALLLNDMWRAAGFDAVFLNPVLGMPSGHTISAVRYDGQWHMYDARLRGYFLNRDNRTVASLVELDRDDDLIRRGLDYENKLHHHWSFPTIMHNYMNSFSDWYDGYNAHYNNPTLFNRSCPQWDSSLDLHAGQTIELRWDNRGKWWNRKDLSPEWLQSHRSTRDARELEPLIYGNGVLRCALDPDLADEMPLELTNMEPDDGGFRPVDENSPASMTYRIRVPYFVPELRVKARGHAGGGVKVEFSPDDGATWVELGSAGGGDDFEIDLASEQTQLVTWYSEHKYGGLVRFSAAPGDERALLRDVSLQADLFYRPMILPALERGDNRIVYSDDSPGRHARTVSYNWLQNTNILLSDEEPAEGDLVDISAVVANTGGEPAKDVKVRFFDGDPADGGERIGEDVTIESIPAGQTALATIEWTARQFQTDAGTGVSISSGKEYPGYIRNTIHAVVDPEDEIAESDEADNAAFRPVTVYNKAELVLKDPSFVTFNRDGNTVTVTALVRNQNLYGHIPQARAARNVRVRFYDGQPQSGDMDRYMIGESVIPSIAPGEFGVARCNWDVSGISGARRVYVVVDPLDEIPERWQGNRSSYMLVKKDIEFTGVEAGQ